MIRLPLPRLALPSLGLMAVLTTTAAMADVPKVAADIAPVHALAARVMQGLGAPDLIVRPGASPHGYAMRPSEARALEQADLVLWVGEALTPWLEGPIETLAGDAAVIELMAVEGTHLHAYREGITFARHDHGHDDDHDHAHEGEDHADHDHDHEEKPESHGHDHSHEGEDGHAWLDPANARVWLAAIAEELARLDPDNAATYAANATAGQQELTALEAELTERLAPLHDKGFVVFHDAYQYFEHRFGLAAAGAISLGDATSPSAARIAGLQAELAGMNAACVFAEPQFSRGLVDTVFGGSNLRIGLLDPLGQEIAPGAGLYPQLLRNMADAFADCLGD